MTEVIHTGDTHLGYRQYHSPERQRDFLNAFRQVIDDACDQHVDAVVHAGDLFHDRRPRLTDIMGALSALRDLADADIPFLAVVGNHEDKLNVQWLDLFESLGLATRLGSEPTQIGNTAFYGLDFVPRARRDDLTYDFDSNDADHAALLAHGLFEPFEFGDWDAGEILEASPVEFDAMLLGDNHAPDTREMYGTWLTYCGSTERASADEREARGYNLVRFEDSVDIRRRSIDTRPFVFVDLELAESEGIERVRNRVGQYDLEEAVLIISLAGDGQRVPPAQIEEYAQEQGALVARVSDSREFEEESAYSVRFADPDAAVRERIQELGLSQAAQELDNVVRTSKIADSNVDDEIESRVRDLVSDADPAVFEPEPEPVKPQEPPAENGGSPSAEGTTESGTNEPNGSPNAQDTPDSANESPEESNAGESSPQSTQPTSKESPSTDQPVFDEEAMEESEQSGDSPPETNLTKSTDDQPDSEESDDQATMEDYL